jgi:hypothetical protein
MEFPPATWSFQPPEQLDTYVSQYVDRGPRAIEVALRFDRLVASNMRIFIGGKDLLKPRWSAESILGDKFAGT